MRRRTDNPRRKPVQCIQTTSGTRRRSFSLGASSLFPIGNQQTNHQARREIQMNTKFTTIILSVALFVAVQLSHAQCPQICESNKTAFGNGALSNSSAPGDTAFGSQALSNDTGY